MDYDIGWRSMDFFFLVGSVRARVQPARVVLDSVIEGGHGAASMPWERS